MYITCSVYLYASGGRNFPGSPGEISGTRERARARLFCSLDAHVWPLIVTGFDVPAGRVEDAINLSENKQMGRNR